jgi:hypothetical protein
MIDVRRSELDRGIVMKYRKKEIIIEAIQWDGKNNFEIEEFALGNTMWCGDLVYRKPSECWKGIMLSINTFNGLVKVESGDYIIKGLAGEIYPCRADIFEQSYERVEG